MIGIVTVFLGLLGARGIAFGCGCGVLTGVGLSAEALAYEGRLCIRLPRPAAKISGDKNRDATIIVVILVGFDRVRNIFCLYTFFVLFGE